jgi:hypothetical protein
MRQVGAETKVYRGEVEKHVFDWNMRFCSALELFHAITLAPSQPSHLLDIAQTDTYGQVQTGIHWKYRSSQFTKSLAPKLTCVHLPAYDNQISYECFNNKGIMTITVKNETLLEKFDI